MNRWRLIGIAAAALLLLAPAASALYAYEGFPLAVAAQGEVQGSVIVAGTYGLCAPPAQLQFELPANPVLAKVYTGVWGGTEQHTGRADLTINGMKKVTYTLLGERDRTAGVYTSSHGVTWISYDATGLIKKGQNTVIANTSRGDPDSAIDGRIYAVLVVAVVEEQGGERTRYWIAEGNENLHGEGWAGANPTRKDTGSLILPGAATGDVTGADLTVLLLASNRDQPDYLVFNGHDLGMGGDIGNERSFDAGGDPGTDSRYVDCETLDVTGLIAGSNAVTFERGRDLDGDGMIATAGSSPEGEDYIHPCLAVLTVTRTPGPIAPDCAIERLNIENAYAGETATATAEISNYGAYTGAPVRVSFSVGGRSIGAADVTIGRSGKGIASAEWPAVAGKTTVAAGIADSSLSREITIGTLPDLSVTVGTPVCTGASAAGVRQSPLHPLAAIAAAGIAVLLTRPRRPAAVCILLLACIALPAVAGGGYAGYELPVTVANTGGSDAPAFSLSVYLDEETAAFRECPDGLSAGASDSFAIPLFTTPGSHAVSVVIDEKGAVREASVANNRAGGRYDFP